jgi:hypothetical protein
MRSAHVSDIALSVVLIVGFSTMARCQVPDAPTVQSEEVTWKQTLDWKFASVHGAYFGAMLWDQHETLKGEASGCALEGNGAVPYRASRWDLMRTNLPVFAGITVADLFLRKAGVKWAWMTGAGVGISKHVHAVVQWKSLCR